MYGKYQAHLQQQLDEIRGGGLEKIERVLQSAQGAHVAVPDQPDVLNFCANNYLGLSSDPRIIAAAQRGLSERGFGLSSVRFICGTQDIHQQLERTVSDFLGTEDTILYSSCFDANGGLFETLLTDEDAIISDQLNHASIIDGVRLCKARRYRYANRDMADLRSQLIAADEAGARFKMIATDGVFSMDGYVAKLPEICDLAEEFDALVMVDDSHATGFFGPDGRGTPAFHNVVERVDIVTSTLGKALGGASGGFTSGRREIIQMLRQRSRPYLFSNALAPSIVSATLAVFELLASSADQREQLIRNTQLFRTEMTQRGFEILPGEHPIVPVMFYDAKLAGQFAERLLAKRIYVIAFTYPVVPQGQARIRVQLSAAHSEADVRHAIDMFTEVRESLASV